jgi:transposase
MEATGIYWRPVWQVLADEGRMLILANAAHVKNVPGARPTSPTRSGSPICSPTA